MVQRSALCGSRRELSNEYLLAKFGFDTAENEPCKVCALSAYRSPRYQTKAIPESMSFADIHNIGKKDTKYFKYKPSTAPFWQRSMCRYASDYVDRALRMTQGEIYITFPVYFINFILFHILHLSSSIYLAISYPLFLIFCIAAGARLRTKIP